MEEKSTRPLRNEQLWLLTGGILLIAFIALSFAMYFTRSFMIPFVFSVFLCAMVSPVDNLIVNRLKMPRWCGFLACIMAILFLFISIFFVGKYAVGSINDAIKTVNIKIPESEKQRFHEVESGFLTLAPVIPIPEVPPAITYPPQEDLKSSVMEPEVAEEPSSGVTQETPAGEETQSEVPSESEVPTETETPAETESTSERLAPSTVEIQPSEGPGERSENAPAKEAPTESEVPSTEETQLMEVAGDRLEKAASEDANEEEAEQKTSSQVLEETIDYWLQKIGINPEILNAKICISSVYAYIPAILRGTLSTLQTFFSFSILMLLFCIFILMGRNPKEKIKNEIYNEIEFSIQKYLNIKFFISFMTGISVYIVFLCLGSPMAFVFGLLAFVLNFIPSIGSIIATVLPIPILMLTMKDISNTGLFIAFFVPCLIQNFFGNFLDPKMQGEGLKLHPVMILLALGYFGVIWGIFGMLLAAPMTAALRVFLLEFQMTRWIALLMGGEMPSMKQVLEMNGRADIKESEK